MYARDYDSSADSEGPENEMAEFIQSLLAFPPQEAAVRLNNRLLAEEKAGQIRFNSLVTQAEHVVEILALPAAWQQELRAELKLAREYEVEKPIIPTVPVATPLLVALTSGELRRVFEELMLTLVEYVPLLAEEALRQHKTKAVDEWEGVRFLDMLLHISSQGTRNPDNQRALYEWGIGARLREEQEAQEQLLPERKQVVTEADRPRLLQRLQQLTEHWEAKSNPRVQAVIQTIKQRLAELDEVQLPTTLETSVGIPEVTSVANHDKPSARRIALLHLFNHKPPIRNDKRAEKLAEAHQLSSGEHLYKKYKEAAEFLNLGGLSGQQLQRFIKDIEAVLPFVEKQYQQEVHDKLKALKRK